MEVAPALYCRDAFDFRGFRKHFYLCCFQPARSALARCVRDSAAAVGRRRPPWCRAAALHSGGVKVMHPRLADAKRRAERLANYFKTCSSKCVSGLLLRRIVKGFIMRHFCIGIRTEGRRVRQVHPARSRPAPLVPFPGNMAAVPVLTTPVMQMFVPDSATFGQNTLTDNFFSKRFSVSKFSLFRKFFEPSIRESVTLQEAYVLASPPRRAMAASDVPMPITVLSLSAAMRRAKSRHIVACCGHRGGPGTGCR